MRSGWAPSAGSEINAAKIRLANEVTTLCHGAEAAAAAEATAREVFEKGGVGEDLPTLALTTEEVAGGDRSIVRSREIGQGSQAADRGPSARLARVR